MITAVATIVAVVATAAKTGLKPGVKSWRQIQTTIGHFRITFGLFFKASPGAHLFIWKLVCICMWIKTNFHMKGWAPRLALKKRPKVIRKWSIVVAVNRRLLLESCHFLGLSIIRRGYIKPLSDFGPGIQFHKHVSLVVAELVMPTIIFLLFFHEQHSVRGHQIKWLIAKFSGISLYRCDRQDRWRGALFDRRRGKFFIPAIVVATVAVGSDQGVSTWSLQSLNAFFGDRSEHMETRLK